MATEEILVRLRAVGQRAFQRDMDTSADRVQNLGTTTRDTASQAKGALKGMAGAAAAAGAAMVLKDSIKNAVNLGESISATNVIFKDASGSVTDWAKTSTKRTMMAEGEALTAANTFGTQLKNSFGMSNDEAAEMSKKMVTLGADMGSLYNATPQEAVEALGSALKGENDPIERFGVTINEAAIKQEALKKGLYSGKGEISDSAKRTATLGLIWKQTTDAQGDAVRTQDSLANRARVMKAQYTALTTQLGAKLIPILEFLANNLKLVAVAIGVVTAAWLAYKAATLVATLQQIGFNFAMLASPIFWIPAAIIAVGLAFVIAYKKVEWFRKGVNAVFNWIKTNWKLLLVILTGPIGVAALLIIRNFDKIKAAAGKVWDFVKGLPGKIAGLASKFASAAANIAKAIAGGISNAFKSAAGFASDIGRAIADWLNAHTPLGDKISLPGLPDFTLPALAEGGTITRAGSVMVGERGPEILSLPAGAQVAPLTGGTTANFYLDGRLVATAVAQATANQRARR